MTNRRCDDLPLPKRRYWCKLETEERELYADDWREFLDSDFLGTAPETNRWSEKERERLVYGYVDGFSERVEFSISESAGRDATDEEIHAGINYLLGMWEKRDVAVADDEKDIAPVWACGWWHDFIEEFFESARAENVISESTCMDRRRDLIFDFMAALRRHIRRLVNTASA